MEKVKTVDGLIKLIKNTKLTRNAYFFNDCMCVIGAIMNDCGIDKADVIYGGLNTKPIDMFHFNHMRKKIFEKYPFLTKEDLKYLQMINDRDISDIKRKEELISYLELLKENKFTQMPDRDQKESIYAIKEDKEE